ncbi:SHOCT domain-containing protein [Halorussus marinus]|uniref:SHOCT domain-containing protein n=1 Tax=Halorussus marinus TaxID=2505976 RepID=UPI00106EB9C0|nr:SHOCT domain-containing protein [Halorussus marinus]
MVGPPSATSDLRPWHRLLEHYTPDGRLGRLLLAALAGGVGAASLLLAIWSAAASVVLWPLVALAATAAGLGGVALALIVLWPVYLSLIGNVESASAYAETGGAAPSSVAEPSDPDDAVALLKRRYAAGEISETEFESRLDDLLGVDAALAASRSAERRDAERPDRDAERN